MINLNRLSLARAMEKAPVEFKPVLAAQEFAEYQETMKSCANPPPCLKCDLETWYFCSETGYTCGGYFAYENDPKAEKEEFPDADHQERDWSGVSNEPYGIPWLVLLKALANRNKKITQAGRKKRK